MKKSLLLLSGLAIMMSSCQSDDFVNEFTPTGDGNVNFNISAPEAMEISRAGNTPNSALGGISNIDWSRYDLRYQLAVYQIDDAGNASLVVPSKTISVDAYSDVNYSLRLTPNRKYTFVAWADFVEQGSTADLHYDTADLCNILCLDTADKMLNDETRDAYFITETVEVGDDAVNLSLILKRPFAKLRIVTTDWGVDNLDMPGEFDVTYYGCSRFEGINALTGEYLTENVLPDAPDTKYHATINTEAKEYSLGYDANDNNRTLIVDYLVANPTQSSIHLKFAPGSDIPERDFSTDIPIRRNWLTTILGDLLTTAANIAISCDEAFLDEFNSYYGEDGAFTATEPRKDAAGNYFVETPGNLVWIGQNISSIKSKNVTLVNDIDLRGYKWTPITSQNNISVFDGNGHTIRNISIEPPVPANPADKTDRNCLGLFGLASNITIKNLNIENVTINRVYSHAGALIGCAGLVSGKTVVENCTVKHVFIRNNEYSADMSWSNYNAGGLIGILDGTADIKDCHAEDVNIESGWRVAGLVGFCNMHEGTRGDVTFTNCSVKDSSVHFTFRHAGGTTAERQIYTDSYQFQQIGSIVGHIYGLKASGGTQTYTFTNCTQSGMTYKFFGHAGFAYPYGGELPDCSIKELYELHTGDEGVQRHSFNILYYDGEYREAYYGPQHTLFGILDAQDVIIDGETFVGEIL